MSTHRGPPSLAPEAGRLWQPVSHSCEHGVATLLTPSSTCRLRWDREVGHKVLGLDTCLPPDDALWCRVTKPVPAGGLLSVLLTAEPRSTPGHPVKTEPAEPTCPAPAHDLQLLPQQAGMASILATAVINSECWAPQARSGCSTKEGQAGQDRVGAEGGKLKGPRLPTEREGRRGRR